MGRRPGCLAGLFELALLSWVFDFLQDKFGFGKGASCSGCGCGFILVFIFLVLACQIIGGTNWFHLF